MISGIRKKQQHEYTENQQTHTHTFDIENEMKYSYL